MSNQSDSRRFLSELRKEIAQHPAVNHLFLNRLATSPFSKQDYRVFAENHYALVCVFTRYLENLLLRAPDSSSKLWLSKVLVDEYGEGSDGKDHSQLYARFLDATGGSATAMLSEPIRRPAQRFIQRHLSMVQTRPFLEGLGAVGPGHEWAIPQMFEALIVGLRRAGFSEEEIGYFTLHVEQDDDHGRWLGEALEAYTTTDATRAQVRAGALASLEARGRFWSEVQTAVVQYRQPHSIRQDGPRPRGIAHEVLLTAWDGTRLTRGLESWFSTFQRHRRVVLSQLVHPA